MLAVILLYVMIQMWLYDSDKKDRKKQKRKTAESLQLSLNFIFCLIPKMPFPVF